jgi:tetratricopeptide (TPR) repeat protein
VRFQELRDDDGTVLARGLHPAIAVVAANALARAVVTSSARAQLGCVVVTVADVDGESKRAEEQAQQEHDAALVEKKARVADAERALQEATEVAAKTAHATSVAASHLSRFDDLASALGSAQESYEAAVRADAEAARSLAAALAELDRTLGQRHSASTSLEQARKSRDNGEVPDAVIHQALNLQAALAKAEADRYEAVQQADEICQAARKATTDALHTLEATHKALTSGAAHISAAPAWGPGVPLPGLVGNYRDQLAAALGSAQAAESNAQGVEAAAQEGLDQERRDLDALASVSFPLLKPHETVARWVSGDHFDKDAAVFADDAFSGFGAEGAASLITALSARGCQVIYLTEDPELLGWAIALPHEVGGASTVSSSKSRALASVGS